MTEAGNPILWQPSAARIARARATAFAAEVSRRHGVALAGHEDLYRWSVSEPARFWTEVWRQCGVVGEGPGETAVQDRELMPGARWFPGARLNYAENLLQGDPGQTVLIFQGECGPPRRLTRGQLESLSGRLAASLQQDGVKPGDRVAGFLPNLPETVIAMLAAARLGAVWSSCSPDFGVQGVLDRFGQIAPRVLFAADGYRYGGKEHDSLAVVGRLQEKLPDLKRTVIVPFLGEDGDWPGAAVSWEDYLSGAGEAPPPYRRLPFDHPLFIMYSSGTTGLPKCMVHSAGGTLLQHLKEHQLHCDLGPADTLFYFTTCGWMMWNWLVSGLASGSAVVLYDGHPLRPETTLWDLAAREGITVFGASAKYLAACQKADLRPGRSHDLEPLRCILSTGSPLLPESFDYVYSEIKSDLQLSSISGGTDIISCFALGSPVLPVRRGELQCRGLGMDVQVFDEQGRAVTATKGELVCTGAFPSMPTGFWNDPDGSRYRDAYFRRYPGNWCHGDFAELRPEGGMVIHGRSDTVLNPGGVRIGTAEIYRVVEKLDEVTESLAVGQQWEGDVRIILFVVLRPGLELTASLAETIKSRLREEKSPRHVPGAIIQAPALPRTISGKLVELAVANILHGRPVENTDALADPGALDFFRDVATTLR
jgi:acetoacetyl-CoA synthetase